MTHDHNPVVHFSLCRHEFLFVIMERPLVIEPTKMDRAMHKKLLHAHEKRSPPRMRSSKLEARNAVCPGAEDGEEG